MFKERDFRRLQSPSPGPRQRAAYPGINNDRAINPGKDNTRAEYSVITNDRAEYPLQV